ncbi:hypothetical protein QJS66_18845 [Kocuria rhizophila]|nr:hypothetical protein QJS66_18845 [Kocuria rhizophila]
MHLAGRLPGRRSRTSTLLRATACSRRPSSTCGTSAGRRGGCGGLHAQVRDPGPARRNGSRSPWTSPAAT